MRGRVIKEGAVLVALAIIAIGIRWSYTRGTFHDASTLSKRLRTMDGVEKVHGDQDRTESLLFPSSSTFIVTMEADASPAQVLAVVDTAYRDMGGTMRRNEVDLSVTLGGTEILLHTYRPDADEVDLLRLVHFILEASAGGERVNADINARDVEALDGDLVTDLRIELPPKSTEDDVLPRLEAIRTAGSLPADTDLSVIAADGAGLGASRGLPTETDIEVWRQLEAIEVPGASDATVRVEYTPYQFYSSMRDSGFANVTILRPGEKVIKGQLAAVTEAVRRVLRPHHHTFVYNVTVNGNDRAWARRHGDLAAS